MIGRRGVIGAGLAAIVAAVSTAFAKVLPAQSSRVAGEEILPGNVRVRALPCKTGYLVAGPDVKVEVMQRNGEWMDLPYITRMDIAIRPDHLIEATMSVLLTELDIPQIGVVSTVLEPLPGAPPEKRLEAELRRLDEVQRGIHSALDDAAARYEDVVDDLRRHRIARDSR